MIYIYLEGDESNVVQIDNISSINTMDELISTCARKFKGIDADNFGFKSKTQGILIEGLGDIDKSRKVDNNEQFMQDKDYYDDNLQTD